MGTPRGGVQVDLPARLNLLGNPSDANEGDHCVVSAAIGLRAQLSVRPARDRRASLGGTEVDLPAELPAPAEGPARLLIAALNGLVRHSPEARERLAGRGFEIRFDTAVPRGSGMGGSSLLVVGVLAALRDWRDLDPRTHHLYRLAEWAQWAEEHEAGLVGGYIDFYAPIFGGLVYVDFRGKLLHPAEGEGPFATIERLDPFVPELPLAVAFSGIQHDSGDVHGPMRARYIEEWRRGEGPLLPLMRSVGDCGWKGKQALLRGDWDEVGALMNENHALVDQMMRTCGLDAGAGRVNNALIDAARRAGALGAKLSGAGGGGSILALARPGSEEEIESALGAALADLGSDAGRTYRPSLALDGLRSRPL